MHAGSILVRHCGLSNIQRLGLTDDYKSGTEVSHWLHFFYGLSFLQPNDVSDAFAFDIMSCSPTSDKYEKFGDYFCSTYLETAVFPPSLWAQIPSDARRTNNGLESFHRHFNAQFTSPHPTFFIFWDEIVKQQTVTHITMNDLNIIAPITILNADASNAFSEPDRNSNSSCPRDSSSCAQSATAMMGYTIYRRVLETFTAECIGFTLKVCIATCL